MATGKFFAPPKVQDIIYLIHPPPHHRELKFLFVSWFSLREQEFILTEVQEKSISGSLAVEKEL